MVTQTIKNLPAMQETGIWSLSQKDPLKQGMATHSSILARRMPWTERNLAGYSPWGHKESATTEWLTLLLLLLLSIYLSFNYSINIKTVNETWLLKLVTYLKKGLRMKVFCNITLEMFKEPETSPSHWGLGPLSPHLWSFYKLEILYLMET